MLPALSARGEAPRPEPRGRRGPHSPGPSLPASHPPDGREGRKTLLSGSCSPSSPVGKGGRLGEEGRAPMRGSTEGNLPGTPALAKQEAAGLLPRPAARPLDEAGGVLHALHHLLLERLALFAQSA